MKAVKYWVTGIVATGVIAYLAGKYDKEVSQLLQNYKSKCCKGGKK